MKYKVEFYGWEMDAQAYSLTNQQVEEVKDLMEEMAVDELWEVRSEMEDIGIDLWDEGDVFRVSKPFYNDRFWGKVTDEEGNVVLELTLNEMGDIYENFTEDVDGKYPYDGYHAFPEDIPNVDNLLLIVDENKGGLFESSFESDTAPTKTDFSVMGGDIESPNGDFDFISRVFFKTTELEPEDYLDNTGKAATVEIYRKDGTTII